MSSHRLGPVPSQFHLPKARIPAPPLRTGPPEPGTAPTRATPESFSVQSRYQIQCYDAVIAKPVDDRMRSGDVSQTAEGTCLSS